MRLPPHPLAVRQVLDIKARWPASGVGRLASFVLLRHPLANRVATARGFR